jgi:hypothetical protein
MSYERCTCPDEERCELRLIMLRVRNAIADVLQQQPGGPGQRVRAPDTLLHAAQRAKARRGQVHGEAGAEHRTHRARSCGHPQQQERIQHAVA